MIMLGVILVLLAALLGLGGLWLTTSGEHARFQLDGPLGLSADLPPSALVILGMLAMGLLWAGWWMMKYGTKRGLSRRRERKELERQRREHERALAETNAKLGRERETAAEAERRREEERLRESRRRVEADRRRDDGRDEELRRQAAERDFAAREAAERDATARESGAHPATPRDGRDPLPPRP